MYDIIFKESARRELYDLPSVEIKKISKVIDKLSDNPRPKGVKKIKRKRIRIAPGSLWKL